MIANVELQEYGNRPGEAMVYSFTADSKAEREAHFRQMKPTFRRSFEWTKLRRRPGAGEVLPSQFPWCGWIYCQHLD